MIYPLILFAAARPYSPHFSGTSSPNVHFDILPQSSQSPPSPQGPPRHLSVFENMMLLPNAPSQAQIMQLQREFAEALNPVRIAGAPLTSPHASGAQTPISNEQKFEMWMNGAHFDNPWRKAPAASRIEEMDENPGPRQRGSISRACYEASYALSMASSVCSILTIAVKIAFLCSVGLVLLTVAVQTACYVHGHLQQQSLPYVATRLPSGEIVNIAQDDSQISIIPLSPNTLLQKRDDQPTLVWPTLGNAALTSTLLITIGMAANGSLECPVVDEQRCIVGATSILTCTNANKWVMFQSCTGKTTCTQHPQLSNRVLCQ